MVISEKLNKVDLIPRSLHAQQFMGTNTGQSMVVRVVPGTLFCTSVECASPSTPLLFGSMFSWGILHEQKRHNWSFQGSHRTRPLITNPMPIKYRNQPMETKGVFRNLVTRAGGQMSLALQHQADPRLQLSREDPDMSTLDANKPMFFSRRGSKLAAEYMTPPKPSPTRDVDFL